LGVVRKRHKVQEIAVGRYKFAIILTRSSSSRTGNVCSNQADLFLLAVKKRTDADTSSSSYFSSCRNKGRFLPEEELSDRRDPVSVV
jgi:hypothetical protein